MRIGMNFDLPNCLSTQILYMKVVMSVGSRNTACGHNDFCFVRLNGPDAKVSCPSGCCRIILPLLYLIATSEIVPTKTRSRS